MNLDRVELRKVQHRFSSRTSRLLQCNYQDYDNELKKYIDYLKDEPLIFDYIESCGYKLGEAEEEVNLVFRSHNLIFTLGDSEVEEVKNIFGILEQIVIQKRCVYAGRLYYSLSSKFQDQVKAFNDRVVKIFYWDIEEYLTGLGIEMGIDESVKFEVHNGQLNYATDNSTINAQNINNYSGNEDVIRLIDQIRQSGKDLSKEDQEVVSDSLDVIEEELHSSKPRQNVLKTSLYAIKAIAGTAGFAANVATFIQYLKTLGLF